MPTVQISLKWRDVEGATITEQLNFDSADVPTVAAAQTAIAAYEALLQALSGAVLEEANVKFGLTLVGGQLPDGMSRVSTGAWFGFRNSDNVGDGLYIPAILDSKIIEGVVDTSDGDVAAFIAQAEAGTPPLSSRGSASLWANYVRGFVTQRRN